jgi:hypothetical protein
MLHFAYVNPHAPVDPRASGTDEYAEVVRRPFWICTTETVRLVVFLLEIDFKYLVSNEWFIPWNRRVEIICKDCYNVIKRVVGSLLFPVNISCVCSRTQK